MQKEKHGTNMECTVSCCLKISNLKYLKPIYSLQKGNECN